MKKHIRNETQEGIILVEPKTALDTAAALRAALVQRFGEADVTAASQRTMWPKGRGI